MNRILFVCLGNICRSPLAEGLFIRKLDEHGLLQKYRVDSAGTSSFHEGSLPDARTRLNAEQNGLILQSRSRPFRKSDFLDFDLILAMDRHNYGKLRTWEPALPDPIAELRMMRDFDPLAPGADVPDPYYGGANGFQEVFEILDRSVNQLLKHLESGSV